MSGLVAALVTVGEEQLPELARLYRAAPIRSIVLASALAPGRGAALREGAGRASRPFYVADRGRYRVCEGLDEAGLVEELRGLAERIAGVPLAVGATRCTLLARGDYAMTRDDPGGPFRAPHVEALLDFSDKACGEGEVVYTDGERALTITQEPGALAIVDRLGPLARYERYLTGRVGDAEVNRLRVALIVAANP